MTYNFAKQLARGEEAENRLDAYFSTWYEIVPASRMQQRMGIDRTFTRKSDGKIYRIEYKTDWTAGSTGNAFVETISVDTANKPGWAYSSKADILIYYVPDDLLIYVFEFITLRSHLSRWASFFPVRQIPNRGYHTHGLLVPLNEFEQHALQVISL